MAPVLLDRRFMIEVRSAQVVVLCLAFASVAGSIGARPSSQVASPDARRGASLWVCPMHPAQSAPIPGACGVCKMDLVDASTLNQPPYAVDVSTSTPRIEAGVPFTVRLVVRQPDGTIASRFDLVHEMWYHLFIVSDDLAVYQHLHPEPQPDRSWTIEVTLPVDGPYSLLSDFVPTGALPQFIRSTLATADAGGMARPGRGLSPGGRVARAESLAASLEFSPAVPVAGQVTRMTYRLTDPSTGAPTVDLQPYLGAFGHTLVVRDGVSAWVHSHPVDNGVSLTPRSRGGPEVSFDAWFAEPGRYRAWTQFMRGGDVTTVSFTFDVAPRQPR